MATSTSTFELRKQLLDCLISVDLRVEELEHRLKESWPSDLAAQKNELQICIGDAIAAENRGLWGRASHQLHYCLNILIIHKKSLSQELMLWLVKRICVPLAFISQFKLLDLETAYKALVFMLKFVWDDYEYGDKGPNSLQVLFRNRVEAMAASVLCSYDKLHAQKEISSQSNTSSKLSEELKWLETEESWTKGLKARCCELLCVQHYKLEEIGNVSFWHEEWKRSIERIKDAGEREFQKRDCMIVEAGLFAEYGTDDKKTCEDWIRDLEKLKAELQKEGNEDKKKKMENVALLLQINQVIRKLRIGFSGHESLGQSALDNTIFLCKYLKECIRDLGLNDDDTLFSLDRKFKRAMDSARHKDAIDYLEEMVKYVSGKPLYVNTPSKLASALAESRYNQASCHERLFLQKELKFFIDTMGNKCSSPDGYSTSFSSASLELCAHHCWSPYCEHDSHGCPEKGDEDDDDDDLSDSDKDDEELAALGHHELESPTEFYTKRQIESDGNNLFHLKRAIALLDEALEHEKKAGAGVFNVVKVQSFLARTHLLIAENQNRRLLGHPSWPFPGHITPEVLVSNNCHTIGQVREYLNRRGTSPIESFALSHYHYRQCAKMFTNHLSSLEKYDYKWVDSIERQKNLYVNLQNMLSMAIVFHRKLHDVLSKMKRPVDDVIQSEAEYVEFLANQVPEALLWSERGRARFLQLQVNRRVQQEAIFPEPSSKDLYEFDFSDEVAWDVIKSSLDACGEGTVFLEYFFEDRSDWGMSGNPLGRVYGVQMASGKVMEPVLMADLTGDPMVLQSLIERFHEAMNPDKEVYKEEVNRDLRKVHELPEDDEKDIREVLEKMYVLLITPDVAEFLKGMQHDHKLVICPSQIFTKVPFAALRNPAELSRNKGYLFQSHTISITPSLRTLKFNKDRYTSLQKMDLMEGAGASVAMGDPRYKNEERRLEKSGAEVESIASLFPNRCEPLKYWEATVANLLERAKLPSERCRSQAFVHIAAHCETNSTDKKPGTKQGILCLTESDCSDIPSSSSMPPVRNDGVLSAENVVKSNIEWCTYMLVLSACGSGKGEIKAEGVLNLPRAFMVAGVPCSIVSQWKVEDDSTAQLMNLFYQSLLKGVDVATALRSTMQEMLDKGSSIKQWAPFMVWGLPTVCLPDELLSEDAGITLLRRGRDLMESYRCSDAILPLKKSLELLKAKRSLMAEEGSYAHVWTCLSLLADCEECQYKMALSNETKCHSCPIPLRFLKYVSRTHLDDLKAQQSRHLSSAVQYLNEAIIVGIDMGPQTLQDIYTRYENLTNELDIWKKRWTLARGSGIDIVVEYDLNLYGSSPHKFLRTCIRSQDRLPRFLAEKVDVERLETASKMSAHCNPESASFLKNLEYLYEILIKSILEDPIINITGHQTLVFIPCKLLEEVPFALLRDKAQPDGEGYLIQSHTLSVVPEFWILKHCNEQVLYLRDLPLMPDALDASLVLCNPAISQEEMEMGNSGPAVIVASQFTTFCKALHGSDSTVESLLVWASLPISLNEEHCQAFFHIEAEISEELAEEIEKYGPEEWRACLAVVRACQSGNGQIRKEVVMRLVNAILTRGIPCALMSNYPVFDSSSDVFFTHFYTSLKNGRSVAAAVRYSMLEMKNEGFELDQWGAFSVFGDPTVCLPQEMLGTNQEISETRYYSDLLIFPS